jgi:N-acetylmuramoyl-L-alanine amidase
VIFLSAGHNPLARGASWRGFVEHDEAVRWVAELARLMPAAQVVPTGPLGAKIRWINGMAIVPDLVVEIHFNAGPNNAGKGSETLYKPASRRAQLIAEHIQSRLGDMFPPSRGIQPRDDLALLNGCVCPAIIIEPEFVYQSEKIIAGRAPGCSLIARLLGEVTT